MIQPSRSPVAPRVVSPTTGEVVSLVDQIDNLLGRGKRVRVRLVGDSQAEALNHLGAVFAEQIGTNQLRLDDDAKPFHCDDAMITVITCPFVYCDVVLRLSGWTRDDLIEYLLAMYPDKCGSVMGRLRNANLEYASGSQLVWKMILDRMAVDPDAVDVESIVIDELLTRIGNGAFVQRVADTMLLHSNAAIKFLPLGGELPPSVEDLLQQHDVALTFTNRRFIERLGSDDLADIRRLLSMCWPISRLRSVADRVHDDLLVRSRLEKVFGDGRSVATANTATLLCRCDSNWKPAGEQLYLCGGGFADVDWSEVDLRSARLDQADFSRANLVRAKLNGAHIKSVDFSNSDLSFADFSELTADSETDPQSGDRNAPSGRSAEIAQNTEWSAARNAPMTIAKSSFVSADLSHANLCGRSFHECDFSDARLSDVCADRCSFDALRFRSSDFRRSDFSGSSFRNADLRSAMIDFTKFDGARCHRLILDETRAEFVRFNRCDLTDASMTGTSLTQCDLRNAILANAKMANINWEFCDLRRADLRGCSFHMGSTRSGLVGSPYPSHGTRTGFYTDEYEEQYFKDPETIRKASLYGSDLRGANITGVDFYLVDLRDAKLDADQHKQLVATGAILDDG